MTTENNNVVLNEDEDPHLPLNAGDADYVAPPVLMEILNPVLK